MRDGIGSMYSDSSGRQNNVIGPAGKPLSLDDLPPPSTKRWVIRRKAEVVTAVRAGLLTLEEACQRSEEHTSELQSLMRISYAVFCLKNIKLSSITNPS